MRRLLCLAALVSAVLLPSAGCSSLLGDCPEANRCDGPDARLVCEYPGGGSGRMVRQPCDSGTCQDTARGPVCSESNTAVHECLTPPHELVASADTVCWQNAVTHCADGFPYDSAACAAGACVDTVACGAVCVSSPVPDHPACTVPGMKQLCVDDVLVQCGCGRHEPKETTCNDVCVNVAADVDPAEGFCALAAAIDERCPDIRGGNVDNAYCDGDIKVSCHRQRDIARTPCPDCRPDAMSGVLCGG